MRAALLTVAMIVLMAVSAEAQLGTKMTGMPRVRPVAIREYQRIEPLAHWHRIYFDAIQCSKAVGNIPLFKHIVWLKAPGGSFVAPPQLPTVGTLRGLWQGGGGPPDTIVIAADLLNADWLVKHELIHYVLQMDHPASKQENDDLWGRDCQAMVGFLPADTTKSRPGDTYLYR